MLTKILLVTAVAAACLTADLHAAEAVSAAAEPVPTSPLAVRPIQVGVKAPLATNVRLPNGTATTLAAALAGTPTVVIFYRGGWCPFCTRHLAGLSGIIPDLTAAGWKIVAVCPDQPSVLAATIAKGDDGVPRLSDAAGDLMRAFGVAYRVDDATDATLKGYKIDLAAASGNDHRWLPVPSVFLVAGDGNIRFVHADPDYKVRLDPQALLAVAKGAVK